MGKGVGETGFAVYLDFKDAIKRDGKDVIAQKYGNLFQMYEKITASNPYEDTHDDLPGISLCHGRSLGGLQPDEHLAGAFCSG